MPDRYWRQSETVVMERTAALPAEATSARTARRLVREVVEEAGRDDWIEAAELAVSEVVTNALLHAHTPMTIDVTVYPARLCVEVRDGNPTLPMARQYEEEASTGRGLAVVAAVALDFGVASLGEDGKVVWFCIGDEVPADGTRGAPPVGDGAAGWADADAPTDRGGDPEPNVVLLDMPLLLWLSARQHHDAVLRELALYSAEHQLAVDFATADAARIRISEHVLRAVSSRASSAPADEPADDSPAGSGPIPWTTPSADLRLHVPPHAGAEYLALAEALDVGERLAVEAALLVHPGLPEIIAVRDWVCDQIVAQLAGAPARPWAGTAQERFETEANARAIPDDTAGHIARVRESDALVVAADDANRIVAVSRPLASMLGWEPSALVGRRVVTLVPTRLREAHVAGFSRHLSTGEAHVLGVPIELPVLHADGGEAEYRFVIERAAAEPGRSLYVAWLEPLGRAPEARF